MRGRRLGDEYLFDLDTLMSRSHTDTGEHTHCSHFKITQTGTHTNVDIR